MEFPSLGVGAVHLSVDWISCLLMLTRWQDNNLFLNMNKTRGEDGGWERRPHQALSGSWRGSAALNT